MEGDAYFAQHATPTTGGFRETKFAATGETMQHSYNSPSSSFASALPTSSAGSGAPPPHPSFTPASAAIISPSMPSAPVDAMMGASKLQATLDEARASLKRGGTLPAERLHTLQHMVSEVVSRWRRSTTLALDSITQLEDEMNRRLDAIADLNDVVTLKNVEIQALQTAVVTLEANNKSLRDHIDTFARNDSGGPATLGPVPPAAVARAGGAAAYSAAGIPRLFV